jgi:hypothetical protein
MIVMRAQLSMELDLVEVEFCGCYGKRTTSRLPVLAFAGEGARATCVPALAQSRFLHLPSLSLRAAVGMT